MAVEVPSEAALVMEGMLATATTIVDAAKARTRLSSGATAQRYEPTDRDRLWVLWNIWAGRPICSMADHLGMGEDTFRNHYAYELEYGPQSLVVDVTKALAAKALTGDIPAIDRILRRWGGDEWRDAVSPGKGSTAVQVNVQPQLEGRAAPDPERVAAALDAVAERVLARIARKVND